MVIIGVSVAMVWYNGVMVRVEVGVLAFWTSTLVGGCVVVFCTESIVLCGIRMGIGALRSVGVWREGQVFFFDLFGCE